MKQHNKKKKTTTTETLKVSDKALYVVLLCQWSLYVVALIITPLQESNRLLTHGNHCMLETYKINMSQTEGGLMIKDVNHIQKNE